MMPNIVWFVNNMLKVCSIKINILIFALKMNIINILTQIGIFAIAGMAQAFVLGVSFNSDILTKFQNWVGYISLSCGILTIVHKINLVEKQFPLDNLLYSGIITFIFVTWMVSWLLGYYMRKSKI